MTIDQTQRAELQRLSEAATPGPWKANCFMVVSTSQSGHMSGIYGGRQITHTGGMGNKSKQAKADAALIAEMRNAIPSLLDALDAAESRVRELEAVVKIACKYREFERGWHSDGIRGLPEMSDDSLESESIHRQQRLFDLLDKVNPPPYRKPKVQMP